MVNNSLYRELTGTDTLTASAHLARLRDIGLLDKQGKGYNTVYKLSQAAANAGRLIFPEPEKVVGKQMAHLLGRNVAYLQNRYIQPLIATKRLEYLFPNNPAHPRQAYRTVGKSQDLS
jgi:ATP-dependent DNA helicase RecG